MTVSSGDFKAALSRWPSGVTVVTVNDGDQPRATTVSAFSSVSLEPPLVLVALNNQSLSLKALRLNSPFAINILAAEQATVSRQCAASDRVGMHGVAFTPGENGCALIEHALVHLECEVHSMIPAGDHQVVFGLVTRSVHGHGMPLVYWHRQYGDFTVLP